MLAKSLASVALFAASASANLSLSPRLAPKQALICGNERPTEEYKQASKLLLAESRAHLSKAEPITIDVHYHVISASESVEDGNISDETVSNQMGVVSNAFGPHGISFNVVNTTRTVNPAWAAGNDTSTMKFSTRKGSYSTLNIWSVNQVDSVGTLGHCSLPGNWTENDPLALIDGCVIDNGAAPGGDEPVNNGGGVLAHEIGHWLGLLHTFDADCEGPGDMVADTPAHSEPNYECKPDVVYDSCPDQPGTDPVHNYMNLVGDPCWGELGEFTIGQEERMVNAWFTYRNKNGTAS